MIKNPKHSSFERSKACLDEHETQYAPADMDFYLFIFFKTK